MQTKINIKKTYKINGQEYDSLEDVPAEIREALWQAATASSAVPTRITVNGVEYDNAEAMPPEIRSLYEGALKAARMETPPPAALSLPSTKSRGPFFIRILIAAVLLAIVVLLLKILR